MKFSETMLLKIILKVTKKPGIQPLFRRYNFRKTTKGGGGGFKLTPHDNAQQSSMQPRHFALDTECS